MIDTHSHLFGTEFENDLEDCIARCKENNIHKVILVGFSQKTNEQAFELSKIYKIFYPTAGIHPSEADENYAEELQKLEAFVKEHRVYAIGECGLDYHYTKENSEYQKKLFQGQLDLAVKMDLPVIIHMREATQDTYTLLREYQGKIRGVMHCYSGSLEMAREFIKLGFYISLGGPVTFKNAKESKRIAKEIPMNRLLVETDCPYMAPVPYRGKRNESAYVVHVVRGIAELRGISFEEVDRITTENSEKLFKI